MTEGFQKLRNQKGHSIPCVAKLTLIYNVMIRDRLVFTLKIPLTLHILESLFMVYDRNPLIIIIIIIIRDYYLYVICLLLYRNRIVFLIL